MKQVKGFLCGIVFAVGMMAIPTVAETVEKTITVLTDYVTVQVDGQTKDVRNFVHDGTTYIALRDVSNVFGYEVGWDDATHVASITTSESAVDVNGEKISADKFKAMYDNVKAYYGATSTKEQMVEIAKEELVTQAVVNQKVQELNLVDAKKLRQDVEAQVIAMEMQYGEETFNQLLAYSGFDSKSAYTDYVVSQEINSSLFAYMEKNLPEYTAVKNGAEEYYNANKENYKTNAVQVKHILIPTKNLETGEALSDEEISAAKTKAEQIAKTATPENFDKLISENNNDPGQGADGYYVDKDTQFVEEFKTTALAFKKAGEISEPVLTSYGYHIIMAVDIYDYLPYEKFLNDYLNQEYTKLDKTYVEKWINEAKITYNEDVINSIAE